MDERNNVTQIFVEKAVIDMKKHPEVKASPSYFWTGTYDGDEYNKHSESVAGNSVICEPYDKNFVTNFDGNISKSKEEKESLRIAQNMLNETDMKIMQEINEDKLIRQKEFIQKFTENLQNREKNEKMSEEKIIEKVDVVNHPKHYNSDVFPQVIDMMLLTFNRADVLSFCKLNAFKYRMRCGLKDPNRIVEDIEKAIWYETKYRELNQPQPSDKQMLLD